MQKRQLRPRKVRLLSQDHVTRKDQTDEAINVEKSNALDGFLLPWPPAKPGSWATSQGLPTVRVLGARVREALPVLLHGCGLELLAVSPLTLCLVCGVKGTVESVPGECAVLPAVSPPTRPALPPAPAPRPALMAALHPALGPGLGVGHRDLGTWGHG